VPLDLLYLIFSILMFHVGPTIYMCGYSLYKYVHYNVHVKIPLEEMKTIKNVLYVFDLKKNLLSIGSFINWGYYIVCDDKRCFVINKHFYEVVIIGEQNNKNRLCRLEMTTSPSNSLESTWSHLLPNHNVASWESQDKKPFGCGPHGEVQNIQ
jgi:hypothetical protein